MSKNNIPNVLTIIRIILTPLFLGLFLSDIPHHFFWGFLVFSVASFTDFLDHRRTVAVFRHVDQRIGHKDQQKQTNAFSFVFQASSHNDTSPIFIFRQSFPCIVLLFGEFVKGFWALRN